MGNCQHGGSLAQIDDVAANLAFRFGIEGAGDLVEDQ